MLKKKERNKDNAEGKEGQVRQGQGGGDHAADGGSARRW